MTLTSNITATPQIIQGTEDDDLLQGTIGADLLIGLGGDDVIHGQAGDDTLQGGAGNDVLVDGVGRNIFDGGDGRDLVNLSGMSHGTTADLNSGSYTDATGTAISNSLIKIESLIGTRFDDVLIGNADNNSLFGQEGNDILRGGAGNDVLVDGMGRNIFDGGDGRDLVNLNGMGHGTTADLSAGSYTDAAGQAIPSSLINIESLIGTDFDDVLMGNADGNSLFGQAGDDILRGGAGDDVLVDGVGRNIFDGGDGRDLVNLKGMSHGTTANSDLAAILTSQLRHGFESDFNPIASGNFGLVSNLSE